MTDDFSMVLLVEAGSVFEAQTISGLLEAAGIQFYIQGASLNDEFGASQGLMGLNGTRVMVAMKDRDRANEAVEAARESGRALEEQVGSDPEPEEG
jgi:hypothetical protein